MVLGGNSRDEERKGIASWRHELRLSLNCFAGESGGHSTGGKQFALVLWNDGLPLPDAACCRCSNAIDPDRAGVLRGLDRSDAVIDSAATATTFRALRVVASGVARATGAGSS